MDFKRKDPYSPFPKNHLVAEGLCPDLSLTHVLLSPPVNSLHFFQVR